MLGASACSSELVVSATSADDTFIDPAVKVSIVIPAYNEARRLPATLTAWRAFLDAQPFESELIVVDDGSRDGTSEAAQRGGATRVLRLQPNRGKGGAVKAGMLAATGEAVAYVD